MPGTFICILGWQVKPYWSKFASTYVMVLAIYLKNVIYIETWSHLHLFLKNVLLCIVGIDPTKRRVFIYFVAKLYLQPAVITEKGKIDQKYVLQSFTCNATLTKQVHKNPIIFYVNVSGAIDLHHRFVAGFSTRSLTMPGKEMKGKEELIMKVVQYFTSLLRRGSSSDHKLYYFDNQTRSGIPWK